MSRSRHHSRHGSRAQLWPLSVFAVLFFAFIAASLPAYAQQYAITVQVLAPGDRPLANAELLLHNTGQLKRTDTLGRANFTVTGPGVYQLTASYPGFNPLTLPMQLNGNTKHVHFSLIAKADHLKEVNVRDSHVTDLKKNESLNVEVVGRDFIRRNLGGSLMATLSRLPGIKTIGIGSGQSKPLIRGLGFNRVVVVDKGVKHEGQQWGADHGLEIDQFAAGEVELIKGAASFIYGSDAIGGVIDVKPVLPPGQHTLGGSVDMIGKSNNDLYGTSINMFGRSQRWFFDARYTYQNYGDYRVPTDRVYVYDYAVDLYKNQLRNTAGNETGAHLNTGYIGGRFRNIFYISNTFSKSGFFANAHGLEPRRVNTEMHDASSRDILMPSQQVDHFKVINRTEYRFNSHRLEAELGFQHNFRQEHSQYVNHGYMPPVYPDTMRIPSDLEREFNKKVYSINLRDHIDIAKNQVTVGVNAEVQDNRISGWSFLVPAFKQWSAGVFAYDKYRLNDHLLLHGALRYDHSHINILGYRDWFDSPVVMGDASAPQKISRANELRRGFNSLVWSAGVNYDPEGNFSLKANVGKSFRMPIAKELAANGVNYHYFSYERGDPNLSPEQSYQADLSLAWNAERWSVQVSPFYNYFPNYIYLNPTADHDYLYGAGNQVFQYAQSRVMRYGCEVQLKYRMLNNLSAEMLTEYLYARQLSGQKQGYTLPFSPPASALFNLTWSPKTGSELQNSYLSVDYRLAAAQNNIVPPEKKTPGYQVINLQMGAKLYLHKQPMIVGLQVQNVFNTRYLNHTSFYRLIELPEAGRNIILSVKIPFSIHTSAHGQVNNRSI